MAVTLLEASTEALNLGSAPVTAVPLSMACWFRSFDITKRHIIISIGNDATDTDYFALTLRGNVAGDFVAAEYESTSDIFDLITTQIAYTANTWHNILGVFTGISQVDVYLDGVAALAASFQEITPAGLNRLRIGSTSGVTPTDFMNGRIAEVAIWDAALNQAEATILSKGFSSLLVRPANLVFYSPLIRRVNASGWSDYIGGVNLTQLGSPTMAPGPPIFTVFPPIVLTSMNKEPVLLLLPSRTVSLTVSALRDIDLIPPGV